MNILEKTTFHVEHTPKKTLLGSPLCLSLQKNSLFMVVIFAVFSCFTWNQPGFLVLYCVFLVILSRQNTCLPVFWLFHVKHRVFFSVLCNFFDYGLVFIYFCCVFGLMWLIINGFCWFFSCFTWNLPFSLAVFAFLWLFLLVMLRFFCFSWFFWGYFLVLDGFYYVFAFNGCTYLKF